MSLGGKGEAVKTEIKTIHRCGYCKKVYFRVRNCEYHETMCHKNPENYRLCLHCGELEKKKVEVRFETYGGEDFITYNLFYCEKINSYLYPPQSEIKENTILMEDIGDGDIYNIPMKKECEFYHENQIIL